MKIISKSLRLLGLAFIIILASFGVGITGAFLPINRERYLDKEIRTEQVDKKADEESAGDVYLAIIGLTTAGLFFSNYLGGELVVRYGVGVVDNLPESK